MATSSGVFSGTAAALGTVEGVLGRTVVVKIVTSGTETVSVTGMISGSTVSSKIMFYDLADGALHSSADMDDGTYFLPKCPVATLIFLGSASSDTKTVTWRWTD